MSKFAKQMPDVSDEELVKIFMRHRTVYLDREITPKTIQPIIDRLLFLQGQSNDSIKLLISSGGGSVHHALKLCDVMNCVMTAPVHGIAVGDCHSAATFVMLHCDKRLSTPHTRFVIHSGTMNGLSVPANETTERNLEQLLAESKTTNEIIINMYMEKLGKNRKEVEAYIGRGDQDFNGALTTAEAVEIGLIEEIVTTKLGIFPAESA